MVDSEVYISEIKKTDAYWVLPSVVTELTPVDALFPQHWATMEGCPLQEEKVEVGNVIYLEANSGAVKRQKRSILQSSHTYFKVVWAT